MANVPDAIPDGTLPSAVVMEVFREVILQKGIIGVKRPVSLLNLETMNRFALSQFLSQEFRGMLVELDMYVVQDQVVSDVTYVRWPKTWWDAFKARWFSDVLLKRWPAEYEIKKIVTQTIIRMCPHLNFDPKEQHLRWMLNGKKF